MHCPPVTICLVPCTVHVSHEPDNLSIAQPSPRPDFITDRRSTVFVSFTTVSGSCCFVGSRSWSLCHVVSSISMFCTLGHSAGLFVSRSEVYSLSSVSLTTVGPKLAVRCTLAAASWHFIDISHRALTRSKWPFRPLCTFVRYCPV